MIEIITDSNGNKLGAYDGDNDSGKFYDANGDYFGEYWGHEVFDKNGMSQGYHNGNVIDSFHKLLVKSLFYEKSRKVKV